MSTNPSANDEQDRKDTLDLLASMGVKLPESTKLPLAALEERLTRALNCAQRHAEILGPNEQIRQKDLPPWSDSRSLRGSMLSSSLEESLVGTGPVGSYNEVRIMFSDSICRLYENGCESVFVFEDPKKDRLIKMQITGVLKVTESIPLLAVEYSVGHVADDDESGMKIINTPGAYTLFRKLLEINAARPNDESAESTNFSRPIPSYLLPLGPLSLKDIGSLCKDVGCVVCGNSSKNVCSRCRTVSYCGRECQRVDWKRHKPACLALDTGTWISFSYASDMYTSRVSRTARSTNDFSEPHRTGSEPNIHGDDAFLVKIQLSVSGATEMLAYDRQNSFEAHLRKSQDPVNFQRLQDVVATGYLGLKIYLWAKRIGKHTLSICLDRKPDQSIIAW